mmetsp:Transcript_35557/g.69756  ORF Transcript_35557/g.69756 Transcript_35557/m.69756 type:complete len:290 (+) Transcript_35557:31-900(+)|eukprot:CAMPEP_0175153292 /NCGR_PEP_ID=MMETSP0087-20121206/19645_1 /TAXON_ID=136419 /ORGANISM="Unknown Unknown, Strain D1" /LENGTH=289 /DNA_ID=CAMNT_0016439933 /DNA_START=18 /DNA_END=887 /DNA_ORIENTATION=-
MEYDENLLDLGADAWDDTALVELFDKMGFDMYSDSRKSRKGKHKKKRVSDGDDEVVAGFEAKEPLHQANSSVMRVGPSVNKQAQSLGAEAPCEPAASSSSSSSSAPHAWTEGSELTQRQQQLEQEAYYQQYMQWYADQQAQQTQQQEQDVLQQYQQDSSAYTAWQNSLRHHYDSSHGDPRSSSAFPSQVPVSPMIPPGLQTPPRSPAPTTFPAAPTPHIHYPPPASNYSHHHHHHRSPFSPPHFTPQFDRREQHAGPIQSKEDEALASLLLSWYWSGYHTGYYQGLVDK